MASATRSLDSILAARKAQVTQARTQHLISLPRNGDDYDSDDDEEVDGDQHTGSAAHRPVLAALDLGRAANQIASRETDVRKRTLAALAEAELNADQLKPLLRPLLLRFADEAEKCRDLAVALFSRWQRAVDASEVAGALPFLVPVMVERLGSDTGTEPSEEVRAALVTLMRDVLLKCRALLRPYLRECGAIALGCCRDQHPDVIKGLCELLAVVAVEVLMPLVKANGDGPKQVKPFSMKLLEAVLPHVRHRHAAVRTCVLRALEELLLCGAGSFVETLVGWRLKNNVPIKEFYGKGDARLNYLADLSRDRSVIVRRQLHKTMSRWMSEMQPEDLYEQEVRLAPYLASGLCDEDAETAEAARREIERLGAEHIEKNIKDYRERIEYGHADEAAAARAITLKPPPPFKCRPTLGARERIMPHFRCLIHPICAELDTWTSVERLQSARLLEVLLVYVEGKVTEFAHQLLPALAKGVDEDNPELAVLVGRAARQFAQFTEVDEYLPQLVTSASDDALNPLSKRVQHVRLLQPLLEGMRPKAAAYALRKYVVPLITDEAHCGTQHTQLRKAVRTMLAAALPASLQAASAELRAHQDVREPLGFHLLMATLVHCASDPALMPTTIVTKLGDGLEETLTKHDEGAWARASELARSLAPPLLTPLGPADVGRTAAEEESVDTSADAARVWAIWRTQLAARLQAEGHAYPEFAETALELLDRLAPRGAAVPRPGLRPTSTFVPAPTLPTVAKDKSASTPAAPRRVLSIAECDDFSEDEDEEAVVPAAVAAASAAAAAAAAAAEEKKAKAARAAKASEDVKSTELTLPELKSPELKSTDAAKVARAAEAAKGATKAAEAATVAKHTGQAEADAARIVAAKPATAPAKAPVRAVSVMKKVMIEEDEEDDEAPASPSKPVTASPSKLVTASPSKPVMGGTMRKMLIAEDDDDDEAPASPFPVHEYTDVHAGSPGAAFGGTMRKVLIAENDDEEEDGVAPTVKAQGGAMRKVLIAEDDDDEEEEPAAGKSMRKVMVEDEDSDELDDFADELD